MPTREPEKIGQDDMQKALTRSGYLLEARVYDTLEASGWWPAANRPLYDHKTEKSRELDVWATKTFDLSPNDSISVRLVIECVNNPQPIAFIKTRPRPPSIASPLLDFHVCGRPIGIANPETGSNEHVTWFARASEYHHYASVDFATQYCTFARKKGERGQWFAHHEASDHENFAKLILAVQNNLDFNHAHRVSLTFCYPILVLQGELIQARPDQADSLTIESVVHVAYKCSTVTEYGSDMYHVDVVTEAQLPVLVQQIEDEVGRIADRLRAELPVVLKSVDGGEVPPPYVRAAFSR